MKRETIAIHGGREDETMRAVAVPIYRTVAYEFDSAQHAADLFDLVEGVPGYRYSRIANPTVEVLARRVAMLEGGLGGLCVNCGQTAVDYATSCITQMGDNIVSVPTLYGTTHTMFAYQHPSRGITVKFAESDRPEALAALIDGKTKALYCEAFGNPAGNIADLPALAEVAHAHGVPLIVDNTVPTPMLFRPIEHGADIVVHSATKYLSGHGTVMGGVIVDSGRFDWSAYPDKYPMFSRPDESYHGLVFWDRFGKQSYLARLRSYCQRINGGALQADPAAMILLGVETLGLRMERHVQNARAAAQFLRDHPKVGWVNYTGFEDNPHHRLMQKLFSGNAPALFSFGLRGGYEASVRVFDSLVLTKRCVNIGDVRSMVTHPAATTHRQMPPEDQVKAGVARDAIRISVGIEHIDDIIADLSQALDKA